ncbi:tRNA adenosine(34) deaminase TadA [Aminiphilus circumscriptus]|uniref:tRNA adenosine(34) deaminase TadA n=1 Tax=Aminiphilus circumscriptus TaxID=290732 RepID=UPI0004B0F221|nr:tRNA adenosine(34) deaminase TadA [Aminiphilus circumscriptus]
MASDACAWKGRTLLSASGELLRQRCDDERFMALALKEAHRAFARGDVPVGAVVVLGGDVVAEGRNCRVAESDPLGHAELVALRRAASALDTWRLDGCTLYVTLEPCPMCAGALLQTRVGELVFGADDPRGGAVGSLYDFSRDMRFPWKCRVRKGVLKEECAALLSRFFRSRRGC